jgi:hypothetical protein
MAPPPFGSVIDGSGLFRCFGPEVSIAAFPRMFKVPAKMDPEEERERERESIKFIYPTEVFRKKTRAILASSCDTHFASGDQPRAPRDVQLPWHGELRDILGAKLESEIFVFVFVHLSSLFLSNNIVMESHML